MAKQKVTQKQTVAVSAVGAVPQKHKVEHYDYNEVAHYLQALHKTESKDFKRFWQIICGSNQVVNGCYIYLPDWDYYMNNPTTESSQKEIMQLFYDFLGNDYYEKMWVSW